MSQPDKAVAETPKPPPAAASVPPARRLRFDRNRFGLAEHVDPTQVYRVPVEPDGTTLTLEELLQPEFWADAVKGTKAGAMTAGTSIRVIWDDCSRVVTLLVKRVGNNWADVGVVSDATVTYIPRPPAHEKFRVMWGGPVDQFRIINIADGRVWRAGFASEADAHRAIGEQERKL
jgi:hypothetical protein